MWHLLEPIHAVTYFAPEARAGADAIGMRGFWMGYVAQRIAPLGAVGPATATACFHGFHPSRLYRALPDAWTHTTPETALSARRESAAAALRRVAGDADLEVDAVDEAAQLAWWAADAADSDGRVLGAANQALPRPANALEALWQATTTLREHRGDGHVAVLVTHRIGPVEAHLIKSGADESVGLQESRAWSDTAWAAAADGLVERGVLTGDGVLTPAGERLHAEIEDATDELAAEPWRRLGGPNTERLAALLAPWSDAVIDTGTVPRENPIGLRPPHPNPAHPTVG